MLGRAAAIGRTNREAARQQYKRIGDLYPDLPWQRGIAWMELQKGHLHHGIVLMSGGNLSMYASASIGDVEQAIRHEQTDISLASGGSLGLFLEQNIFNLRRDYAGLIATTQEPIENGANRFQAFTAAYKLR